MQKALAIIRRLCYNNSVVISVTILLYTHFFNLSSTILKFTKKILKICLSEGVISINWGKKILRGAGIALCVLLTLLLVCLLVSSLLLGSEKTVSVFGFNVFICESDDYETVVPGSAVITTKCEPYHLNEGNLVLFRNDNSEDNSLEMSYYSGYHMEDGVYYLHLQNGGNTIIISETQLVGKAGWASPFLGAFIAFMKTPWGVLVTAVLPCLILVLLDLIKVTGASRPLPEIIPQVKNDDEEPPKPQISVGDNGGASFGKNIRKSASADSVLFTYSTGEKAPEKSVRMSDADVLSLLNSPAKQDKNAVKPFVKNTQTAQSTPEKPQLPSPVAAKRYLDNTLEAAPPKSEAVPEKNEKKRSDAFFAQSAAPQLSRAESMTGRQSSKAIIDLEDALSAASRGKRHSSAQGSANILASKSRSELLRDEEDERDRSRYEVDDILAGLDKKYKK